MNKSFRGLLKDGNTERIRLSTKQGLIGYKVNKFQTIQQDPGTQTEHVVKIFSVEPGTPTDTVEFTDPTLLAVAYLHSGPAASSATVANEIIIFDNVVVNQDIYVTCKVITGSDEANYYIELEQTKLSIDEAAVATLKDMRGRE
jgi:hypothetical protein